MRHAQQCAKHSSACSNHQGPGSKNRWFRAGDVEFDVRWYSDYLFYEGNEEVLAETSLDQFPEVFASGNTGGVFREPVPPTDTEPGQLLLTPLAELPSVAEGLAAESEAPFLQATDAFLVNARAVRAPLPALWPL